MEDMRVCKGCGDNLNDEDFSSSEAEYCIYCESEMDEMDEADETEGDLEVEPEGEEGE